MQLACACRICLNPVLYIPPSFEIECYQHAQINGVGGSDSNHFNHGQLRSHAKLGGVNAVSAKDQ